jgi:hypothetical protein
MGGILRRAVKGLGQGLEQVADGVIAEQQSERTMRLQEMRDKRLAQYRHNLGKGDRDAAVKLEQSRYDTERDDKLRAEFNAKADSLTARYNELVDNFNENTAGMDPEQESYIAAKALLDAQLSRLDQSRLSLLESNPEYASEMGFDASAFESAGALDETPPDKTSLASNFVKAGKEKTALAAARKEADQFDQLYSQVDKAITLNESGGLKPDDKTNIARDAQSLLPQLESMARNASPEAKAQLQERYNRVRQFTDSVPGAATQLSDETVGVATSWSRQAAGI